MARTVIALYDDFNTARSAVEALVDAGFNRSDVSLVANNTTGEYARYFNEEGTYVYDDDDVSAGEGAGFGAVVGALVGLGVALIPGIGPVLAAGPLAAALMALSTNVVLLVVTIYLLRLFGQGMFPHAAYTATARWFSAQRGKALSLVIALVTVALSLLVVRFVYRKVEL